MRAETTRPDAAQPREAHIPLQPVSALQAPGCSITPEQCGCFITFSPEALRRLPQLIGRTIGLLSRAEAALDEPVLVVQSAAGVCVMVPGFSSSSSSGPVCESCRMESDHVTAAAAAQTPVNCLFTTNQGPAGVGVVSSGTRVFREEGWCPHRPGSCRGGRGVGDGDCLLTGQGPVRGGGGLSSEQGCEGVGAPQTRVLGGGVVSSVVRVL
ncbi:unnamed protein product [Pleuronectes platessa]|uniref:Uncharacterized protein n=1 Tax=Pleuronectes platessa TaxID=8262 RepID=A0A9N7Z609_PLEPL|nr:unnamed protein product [Pleuronectes platessa]